MLSGVLPSFEMLMTRWEKLAEDVPTLKKFIDPGLQKAYEYYNRMDETKAYVIAMCTSSLLLLVSLTENSSFNLINCSVVNPNVRLAWITEHWGEGDDYYKKAIKTIKDLVSRLGDVYYFIALYTHYFRWLHIKARIQRSAPRNTFHLLLRSNSLNGSFLSTNTMMMRNLVVKPHSVKPNKLSKMNMLLTHQTELCKLTFCSSGRYVVFLVSVLK